MKNKRKKLRIFLNLIIVLTVTTAACKIGLTATKTKADDVSFYDKAEEYILKITNEERKKNNLGELELDETLRTTARNHSKDMLVRNFFDHKNLDGLSPSDRIGLLHRKLIGLTSENINMMEGYDLSDPKAVAEMFMETWMNSPGHRANILRKESTHLGVGVAVQGEKAMATQNFSETLAYLDNPAPEKIKRGDPMVLGLKVWGKNTMNPTLFDFSVPGKDKTVAGPFRFEGAKADVGPGKYELRFYFPDDATGRSFTIYPGPVVIVE